MNAFNVFLVITGLTIIFISYVISEKIFGKGKEKQNMSPDGFSTKDLTEGEKQFIRNQIDHIIEEISEDIETKTYNRLGQISNEKIISVSELSDQILEKINQNHTEVVFLYNMLNEKEVQLKKLAKKINNYYKSMQLESGMSSEEYDKKAVKLELNQNVNQMNQLVQKVETKELEEKATARVSNDEIIEMYNQGMTVIEISQKLSLGQGEVKLIIDLFQNKKY